MKPARRASLEALEQLQKKKKKKWAGCREVFPPRFTKKS